MNKKWYPCELHCHTIHSDGGFTVEELMKTAAERQLSGICLTDHNTTSGHEETEKLSVPVVLKGIEWTTYFGHMLVLDCKGDVDWRNAVPDNIDEKMKEVHSFGGLVGMAHPYQLGTPICTGGHWDYNVQDFSLVNYMEIWSEGESLMTPANIRAKAKWLSLLEKGYRIACTFGRDWHRKEGNKLIGACTYLLIDGDITDSKIKEAIEKGRTQISLALLLEIRTDSGETIGGTIKSGETAFSVSVNTERAEQFSNEYTLTPETLKVITKKGEVVYEGSVDNKKIHITTEKDSFYVFELWGRVNEKENQLLVLTAPVYT